MVGNPHSLPIVTPCCNKPACIFVPPRHLFIPDDIYAHLVAKRELPSARPLSHNPSHSTIRYHAVCAYSTSVDIRLRQPPMADDTGPKSRVPAHSCAHTYDARNNSLVVAGARPQTKYLGVDKLVPSPCFSTSLTKTPFPSPYSQQTVAMTSRGSGSPRPSESSTDTCLIVSPKHHGRTRREELLLHADNLVVKDFVPHPYARLYNKKHKTGRCRKVWSHALEKFVFTHEEMYVSRRSKIASLTEFSVP